MLEANERDTIPVRLPLFRVLVTGPSMAPALKHGDHLLVRRAGPGSVPPPGSVVVVRLPDGTEAVKRVVRREAEGGVWVEGDNSLASTDSRTLGALPANAVLGRVVLRVWPRPGHVPSSH
jgi:nickel-type superoxide dismutase maturation protease